MPISSSSLRHIRKYQDNFGREFHKVFVTVVLRVSPKSGENFLKLMKEGEFNKAASLLIDDMPLDFAVDAAFNLFDNERPGEFKGVMYRELQNLQHRMAAALEGIDELK